MFCAWAQHFETLLLRTPLQNIDVDVAHTPAFHLQLGWLVKVDRAGADQRRSIVVDNVFVFRIGDSKPRAEREARPIGGSAHDTMTGQISAEGISMSAFFDPRVSGRADIRNATKVRIRRRDSSHGFLDNRLFCATNEDTANSKNYCKVKAFRHLEHRGLPYHRTSAGQIIICPKKMPVAGLHS